MKQWLAALTAGILVIGLQSTLAGEDADPQVDPQVEKSEKRRQRLNSMAEEALERLFTESPKAKRLYDRAHGYAVFSSTKVSIGITGGGGSGVAALKDSGERVYMRMATGGVSVGLGGQKYHIVFLFQDRETWGTFVNNGWEAEASANAVAGTAGANTETTFRNGVAVYQLTGAGLMLQADISGTRYWKNRRLNSRM